MATFKEWLHTEWKAYWAMDTLWGVIRAVLTTSILVFILTVALGRYIISHPNTPLTPCYSLTDMSYVCRDYQVQQCLAAEKYTRAECIVLVGGK